MPIFIEKTCRVRVGGRRVEYGVMVFRDCLVPFKASVGDFLARWRETGFAEPVRIYGPKWVSQVTEGDSVINRASRVEPKGAVSESEAQAMFRFLGKSDRIDNWYF